MNKILTILSLSFLLTACATTGTFSGPFSQRPDVNAFIQHVAAKDNFDSQQLTQWFNQVQPDQKIIATISAPHEGLPWYKYHALFIKTARVQAGVKFWHAHEAAFALAQKRYGVPPQIILGILGVETNYGSTQGTYRVFDALSTLAFDYPPRQLYFRGELEQYLMLTRDAKLNPLSVKGSYAGAIGAPQFMPSSYRIYSVDADGNGYSNLISNDNDVILSVANYFKLHGWKADQPVAQFAKGAAAKSGGKIITLVGENGPEYWLVFHNFDVIMRYNASPNYAMAVYQLSEAIKAGYKK